MNSPMDQRTLIPKSWADLADEAERLGAVTSVQVTESFDAKIPPGSVVWGCYRLGQPPVDGSMYIHKGRVFKLFVNTKRKSLSSDKRFPSTWKVNAGNVQVWAIHIGSDLAISLDLKDILWINGVNFENDPEWYLVCRVITPGENLE